METNKIFNVFFRDKPALILLALLQVKNDTYCNNIAKATDSSSSYVATLIKKLEKARLIKTEKFNRIKIIRLTKKGNEIAEEILKVNILLKK